MTVQDLDNEEVVVETSEGTASALGQIYWRVICNWPAEPSRSMTDHTLAFREARTGNLDNDVP